MALTLLPRSWASIIAARASSPAGPEHQHALDMFDGEQVAPDC
jgi:hypothetical protein